VNCYKWPMYKKILSKALFSIFFIAHNSYAAQTICNDNGGAGWPITDGSNTTIQIDYDFGDAGYLTDVDVDVDISHTYTGDLTASITDPSGSNTVILFERPNTTAAFNVDTGPYGCSFNDIDVLFDDESLNAPIENITCTSSPAFSGNHQPHNASPNDLSAFDTINPTGIWQFNFMDPVSADTGTMNEACLVISSASVTLDQWVSTNATCTDTIDEINTIVGTNLYVCYTLSNAGDESFTLSAVDWNDSLGNDLTSLEGIYNVGDSQTVNFGPFVAGSSPFFQGTTIGTSDATIRGNSPPDFPSSENIFTNEAITVNVSNVLPGSAAKPLYLYNNLSLSRVTPVVTQTEVNVDELATQTWTMAPNLESDLTIDTGTLMSLSVYLREVGLGSNRNITFTVAGSVSGTIATFTQTFSLTGSSVLHNINFAYVGGAPTVLQDGETITLSITNNTSGSGNRRVRVIPADPLGNNSTLFFPSNTIINVDSIAVYNVDYATNPTATAITHAQAGDTLYIRAVISDPFGTFDITSINNLITDPTPTIQATNVASIVVLDDITAAEKTYEFSYTVPAFPVLGDWTIDVTGNEGSVIEGISHSNFIDFLILAPPSLVVVKSASTGSASPGDTITYTILVSNSGLGFADNIVLNDIPSQFIDIDTGSFTCSTGCPASGVTMGTPTFTNDVDGDVINWNLMMGGSLTGGESFSVEYDADVE